MNRNRIALFALMFLLIFNTLVPLLHAQEQGDGQQQSMSEEEKNQRIKDLIEKHKKEREKFQHPKVQEILVELEEEYKKGGLEGAKEFAKKKGLDLIDDKYILVEITFKPGITGETFDATLFEKLGGKIRKRGYGISAYIPIQRIRSIADEVDEIQFIEIPAPITPKSFRSEGLRNIGFSNYSAAGIRGQNVKIAVIDKGFSGLSSSISSGELPSNVIKVDCYTGASCQTVSYFAGDTVTHGTQAAEIIYEMVPAAQLYLLKIYDKYDVRDAKDYCLTHGIDIINYSAARANENFYDGKCHNDTSTVCSAKDAYIGKHSNGTTYQPILWVNSAGNEAFRHYEAVYSPGGYCHSVTPEFTISQEQINAGETINVYLTWNAWPTTNQDYDVYIFDTDFGWISAQGTSIQNDSQPIEQASWKLASYDEPGTYKVCVVKADNASNLKFEMFIDGVNFNSGFYNNATSILNPADAEEVLAVGAINYWEWTTSTQASSSSSRGPTNETAKTVKKPDIMGPTDVSTTLGYFNGTSAAAPHVAGAAALLKSKNTSYTASQLWSALTGSAIDMGSSGKDNIYGYGRLNLPTIYTLDVTKSGDGDGTVASNPGGIDCGSDCVAGYDYNESVMLTASPNSRSKFTSWLGCGSSTTCTVTMSGNRSVDALFDGIPVITITPASYDFGMNIYGTSYIFTVTNVGLADLTPNSISISGANASDFNIPFIDDNCSGHSLVPYTSCSFTVELLPTSAGTKSATLNIFSNDPNTGTLSVPLTANVPYTYTISTAPGSGGTISPSSATVNFDGSQTFTIAPNSGYHISDVKVDGVSVSGHPTSTNTSYTLTISNTKTAHSISATFSNTYKLTISKSGIGAGTITGSTGGLSCGAICSNSITQGTFVSLTASAEADSTFVGWSGGGCSGAESCDVTLNGDTTVTAIFTAPYVVTSMISAGGDYSVALRNSGMLWDWGGNASGQLGDGTTTQKLAPVQSATGSGWIAVSAGYSHTVAIRNDGTLWTWGDNSYGQLGDNTTVNRSSPVQIGEDSTWLTVSAGAYHTVALKTDGTLWAWGANWFGQLGDGSYTDRHLPVKIGADTNWTSIAAGNWHTVAVKNDGTLWAWGANWYGQIGDGTITDRPSPVKIGVDTDWAAITTGDSHTLALKANKTLWAWGYNEDGELGDNTTTERHSPVHIGSDGNWSEISAGDWHNLALKTDGTLWAWGYNYDGELGNGTTNDAWSPIQVGGNAWKTASAGSLHSIAVRSDGTLWGWGANESGQVGDGTTMDRPSPVQVNFQTYILTAIAGTGGAISQAGTMTVSYGAIQTFTVAPNTGHHVTSVTGCGGTLSGNTYTTGPITADCTVSATFASASSYVRILGKGNYSTLQAAYDAAVEGDTIQSQAMTFTENLTTNRNISVTIDGGYNTDFSSNPTITNLTGIVIISSGTVTMKNFNLQY